MQNNYILSAAIRKAKLLLSYKVYTTKEYRQLINRIKAMCLDQLDKLVDELEARIDLHLKLNKLKLQLMYRRMIPAPMIKTYIP